MSVSGADLGEAVQTITLPKQRKNRKPKKEPRFHVVLWNNDYTTFEYVIRILVSILGISVEQAFQFALEVHNTEQAIIFTGSLSQAELIKDKILGYAPDPYSPSNCEPTKLIASLQKAPE